MSHRDSHLRKIRIFTEHSLGGRVEGESVHHERWLVESDAYLGGKEIRRG
ncbi:MAG: hypothetical protein ABFC88_10395 [Thermoguttaceae bacterium]